MANVNSHVNKSYNTESNGPIYSEAPSTSAFGSCNSGFQKYRPKFNSSSSKNHFKASISNNQLPVKAMRNDHDRIYENLARLERKGHQNLLDPNYSIADYHKITWVSPPSSIASSSCHFALKKEIERAESLLNQSIERYRNLNSNVKQEMQMNPNTKDAIRNEFRAMLEEHDSGSCATSLDALESNSNDLSPHASPVKKTFLQPRAHKSPDSISVRSEFDLKCPLCALKVFTSLFAPVVLLPCQHVVCEVCAESSRIKLCPVCKAVVVAAEKAILANQDAAESCEESSASLAEISMSSMATTLTTDSDGCARVEPKMNEAEQLFFIRETKYKDQLRKMQFRKDQVLEAEHAVVSQLESIECEEAKVVQEIRILEEKLHNLKILKHEHRETFKQLKKKEDTISIRQFLIKRSLDSIEFQRLEQQIVQNNESL